MTTNGTEKRVNKKVIEFEPFRAWRYDAAKVNFSDVIAPPYDVISPERQKAFYDKSAHNCIRLILNQSEVEDVEGNDRYTRARDFYAKWKREGILIQEENPAFYLYKQVYPDLENGQPRSRFALFGRLKLVPFEEGVVIPHEKTLAGPKRDRLLLMQAAKANFSPIFGLYPNAEGGISELILKTSKGSPLYRVTDEEKVEHTLWPITEDQEVTCLRQAFAGQKIYIADGHHRYTTALNYSQKMREAAGVNEDEVLPSDYTLAALVHFHDPGLVLEPTHRILKKQIGFDRVKSLEVLKTCFDVQPKNTEELCAHLKSEQEEARKNPGLKRAPSFGLLLDNKQAYLVSLKNAQLAKEKMPQGHAENWYALDVNLVNYLVLDSLWKIDETHWEESIAFTHSDQGALEAMKAGKAEAVFIMKAPPVEILASMGSEGELMPQKSTYFYPKLASGFVFHHHG